MHLDIFSTMWEISLVAEGEWRSIEVQSLRMASLEVPLQRRGDGIEQRNSAFLQSVRAPWKPVIMCVQSCPSALM